jgi:hypothetical protein
VDISCQRRPSVVISTTIRVFGRKNFPHRHEQHSRSHHAAKRFPFYSPLDFYLLDKRFRSLNLYLGGKIRPSLRGSLEMMITLKNEVDEAC